MRRVCSFIQSLVTAGQVMRFLLMSAGGAEDNLCCYYSSPAPLLNRKGSTMNSPNNSSCGVFGQPNLFWIFRFNRTFFTEEFRFLV